MKKIIDARGKQCPLPVIETRKLLKVMTEGIVEVLVDNEIAVQNLTKLAKQMKFNSASQKITEDHYTVSIELKGEESESFNTPTNSQDMEEQKQADTTQSAIQCDTNKSVPCQSVPATREEITIVVLSSDHMGEGNEELGKVLMKGFLYALTELDKVPKKIFLYNSGAKLAIAGSDSLEDLKLLEANGVEILTCGTCLNFYGIFDQLSVGSVTNMYAIAESMVGASNIIKP